MPLSLRKRTLDRRHLLRGIGAGVALPWLSAMQPATGSDSGAGKPRLVTICGGLGFHAPFLFPSEAGKTYEPTPYLNKLRKHQEHFTLFSGLSHPDQNGNNGHASNLTWLTSARRPGLAGFKNTISLDQQIAQHLGGATRMPYLSLTNNGSSLSWTAGGVNIPAESSPAKLYKRLFVDGSKEQVEDQMRDLGRGRSILDAVSEDANRLKRSLGKKDLHKLDEYYSSIRDLEIRMEQSQQWTRRRKPIVEYEPPQDVADKQDIIAKQRLMYDMMRLALQTDSTRVITFSLGGSNSVPSNIPGVKTDWHNLSHHGKDDEKIAELRLIEEAEFEAFSQFLSQLHDVSEGERSLLDHTAVLFGSNLGNASAHDWRNLPIIVAGGGYRHNGYVAHNPKDNTPLANLFVQFGQRMGLEIDRFGSSTASGVRGLEA